MIENRYRLIDEGCVRAFGCLEDMSGNISTKIEQ